MHDRGVKRLLMINQLEWWAAKAIASELGLKVGSAR